MAPSPLMSCDVVASCRLVIEKASVTDEGNYCCRASNNLSIVFSNWVEVSVHQPARGRLSSLCCYPR